jgi:hypothetical protein
MECRRGMVGIGLVLGLLASLHQPLCGQTKPSAASREPRETVIEIELLNSENAGGLAAQTWLQTFEKFEVSLVIRRGLVTDKPELREKTVGTLRYVTLIGKLTRNGSIEFPGKTYARGDEAAIKEWIDELRTYGVQGAPTGKPLWGLSKAQFEELYAGLTPRVENDVARAALPVAIESLKLPAAWPLRWSTPGEAAFKALREQNTVRQPVMGFTQATALAIVLKDRGFGFRPNRLPTGKIELLVEPLSDDPLNHWPIGWPLQTPAAELMPSLFKFTNIDIVQSSLLEVVPRVVNETSVPVVVDFMAIEQAGINLEALKLDHILKRTNWSVALRTTLVPNKLTREYWQDEAGRGFILISAAGAAKRKPGE